MPNTVVNNRQIAKNTIFLYIRMIVVMLIGLYTVRAYLSILGETDYGLYNVIGGVVSMFAFLNGTLATSSQRYFSQALVRDDKHSINRVFCLNLTVYMILIVIVVAFLETVGLWFVNTQMTIPSERIMATNLVYQLSIATFVLQLFSVPYNALIISHERMKAFAYIGILEAFLKLGFVFILALLPYDKLIFYAIFFLALQILITGIFFVYCLRRFPESRFRFYWNRKDTLEMIGFSGWHLLGTFSTVVRSHGLNILINIFFNPAVNAARAVAFQIENAINQLSNNFFVAVKPQMYKSYSNGEIEALNNLVLRSSLICYFLVSILSIPFFFNVDFLLGLWLKEVPEYTISFTQLVIIGGLIDSLSGSAICPALATGKIKVFYLVTGTLFILTLPIAYLGLKLGYDPTSTMVVSIAISMLAVFARAYLLIDLIQLPIKRYIILIAKLLGVTIFIGFLTFCSTELFENNMIALMVSTLISSLLHCIIYLFVVCTIQDKETIINIVKNKIYIR